MFWMELACIGIHHRHHYQVVLMNGMDLGHEIVPIPLPHRSVILVIKTEYVKWIPVSDGREIDHCNALTLLQPSLPCVVRVPCATMMPWCSKDYLVWKCVGYMSRRCVRRALRKVDVASSVCGERLGRPICTYYVRYIITPILYIKSTREPH